MINFRQKYCSIFATYFFCQIKKNDPIMVFASYPVGFPMIKKLHSSFDDISVVTHYTEAKQRVTNEVELFCKKNNIKMYTPVKKSQTKQEKSKQWEQFTNQISKQNKKYKIGIACAYGYLIPGSVINLFDKGMVLAHPSLIPKYRGGSPIFHAIANGEKQSGASFMEISAELFDHGNLLYQVKQPLTQTDSYQQVEKRLSQLMANNIMHVIQNIDSLRPGQKQSQMDTSGIPAHQLQARIYKQKKLNINLKAKQVYNWSRALINPRVQFQGKQIIVNFERKFIEDQKQEFKAGQLVLKGKKLYMKCSDKLISVCSWQQITKKSLPVHTFVNRFINKQTYNNQLFFE